MFKVCLFVVVCEFQSVFVLRNMCDLCVMYRGMLHDLCFVSFACVCECLCVSVCACVAYCVCPICELLRDAVWRVFYVLCWLWLCVIVSGC